LFLQTVTLTAENYSGPVVLESRYIPLHCQKEEPAAARITVGADHGFPVNGDLEAPTLELVMEQAVVGSATRMALGSLSELRGAKDSSAKPHMLNDTNGLVQRWHWEAAIGRTYRLDRLVSLYTSRDVPQPATAAAAHLGEAWRKGIAAVVADHVRAWQERWQDAEVEVEGDPEVQRALRFAVYHLISAANPDDEHVSVGARGLTGEAYKGHVFWDTDIFMLPFYIYTHPPTARALVMYRYHTLPAAREKARAFGYRGALFAWESADTGAEITPPFALAADGTVLRILTGEQEHHISADVAYGVWHYWQATGDDAFFLGAGAEIVFETARFWASRGHFGLDGLHHITHVIGPDEYHEGIDDDAYTNVMAQWNLERAVEAAGLLEARWPQRRRELFEQLGLTPAEVAQWRDTAAKMYTGYQSATHLFEQCQGYFGLEDIGLAAFEPRTVPMDVILGRERTQRSQVVKQADVVMLLYLLWDRLTPEVREANFRYYEPRTAHGSSLSPAIHAAVAARLGQGHLAGRYVRQAAQIDLANSMGNAAGGVHMAALGGLWQAAVMGCGGLSLRADGLSFAPYLLSPWRHLSFPVQWRGRKVAVTLSGPAPAIRIVVHGTAPMVVAVAGGPALTAEPERHYVCRWTENGWEAWQPSGP